MFAYESKEQYVRLKKALTLILKSGKKLRKAFYRDSIAQFTKIAGETYTEFDIQIDQDIKYLLKTFPQDSWCSEESDPITGSSPYQWILDPIDGTNNFANHIPFFCISLCLMSEGQAVAGIIHDPIQRETYIAFEGKSYHLHKKSKLEQVQVPERKIEASILSYCNHKASHPNGEKILSAWLDLEKKAKTSRRLGSTALEIVFVGLGKLSLFFVMGYRLWDIAAAFLFAKNAGVSFVLDEIHQNLLIYNPALSQEIQNFSKIIKDI